MTDEQAVEILKSRQATFYDPVVVEKFIELMPELRRGDAACAEPADTHASLVAGLAQTHTETRHDGESRASALSADAQDLVDEQVARIGGADACLFEFNAARDALIVAHATPRIRRAVANLQIPVGSGVSGWVAANRCTIRRAEPALDVGELAYVYALKTCAAVPVFVRADLFGVLTVYFGGATPSDEQAAVVGLLAQEVGLSIARGAALSHVHVTPPARRSIAAVS